MISRGWEAFVQTITILTSLYVITLDSSVPYLTLEHTFYISFLQILT